MNVVVQRKAQERANQILCNMVRVTQRRMRGTHDAQMVIVRGIAYIVYSANDIRPGEGYSGPEEYCAMSLVDVAENRLIATKEIAVPSQGFANTQLKAGACFVPRILQKDENTLRCFFLSMDVQNRETESWYRDYYISEGCFSDCIYPLWMETAQRKIRLSPTPFYEEAKKQGFSKALTQDGPYLFDVDKVIDGKRYVMLNLYSGQLNALAEFNDALDTLRIHSFIIEPQHEGLCEAAIEKRPDGHFVAILRNDVGNQNYRFALSEDGLNWTAANEWPIVENGSNSKPFLYRYGDLYCMGWQEKPERSRFNIDVSYDFKHWIRAFAFNDLDFSLQYPSLYEWAGMLYICGTHGRLGGGYDLRDSIYFGQLCSVEDLHHIADE